MLHPTLIRAASLIFQDTEKKLSDFVSEYMNRLGIESVFVLTGGCAVHLIQSFHDEGLKVLPMQHEQSGAMAADGYSRIKKDISVCVTTSGPGATNLLTGVCCSYYDSVPTILLTGQVPSNQLKGDSYSRQVGFQETDVIGIYKSVTKYSKLVTDPLEILEVLEDAIFEALTGRMGPVLIDICDDVQRALINPCKLKKSNKLEKYLEDRLLNRSEVMNQIDPDQESRILKLMASSNRPLLIIGGGATDNASQIALERIIKKFRIPFTLTWAAQDMFNLEEISDLYTNNFGVSSSRSGNFIVQNADLLICIGTRLDSHEIGNNRKLFAPNAKKILVDIDQSEISKFDGSDLVIDLGIKIESDSFIIALERILNNMGQNVDKKWFNYITQIKNKYPDLLPSDADQNSNVNPYFFMDRLSKNLIEKSNIFTDCGSNLIWTMQIFKKTKSVNRIISAWNHSPMGYALPASIGGVYADSDNQTICITGDGGLQINIQELATIQRHNLNIKIIVLDNKGHGIIQGTQDQWLGGSHIASTITGGLPDLNFEAIFSAYGIKTYKLTNHDEIDQILTAFLHNEGPASLVVELNEGPQIYPKLLYGNPIQNPHPLLEKSELDENMNWFN
jgi:acetolactate synthase-1/2/3 large subunit